MALSEIGRSQAGSLECWGGRGHFPEMATILPDEAGRNTRNSRCVETIAISDKSRPSGINCHEV